MSSPQLPTRLWDLVLSFAPALPMRATSKHQCGQKDQLSTILENELMKREILQPLCRRPNQLRWAAMMGFIPRMKMLFRFTDLNAQAVGVEFFYDGTDDGEPPQRVVPPCAPLFAAAVCGRWHAVRVLLRAGAHFEPVLWEIKRSKENNRRAEEDDRRAKEDRRRAKEDNRRAEEDDRRAKEDRRRAKEDRRRARQDLRRRSWDEEREEEEEVHREEQEDDMQEPLAEEEKVGEKDDDNEDKDGMLEREELERATSLSVEAAHQHTNALIAEVLMHCKAENMYASCLLKTLDIVEFRLTRCARCPEVSNALRTSEKLSSQRERIEGQGGELQPGFAGGMWVFVLLTQEDFVLAHLEPSDHAILMYPWDEEAVRQALGDISKDRRPKLKQEGSLHHSQAMASNAGDCSEFEEIIVDRTFLSVRERRDIAEYCAAPSF